MINNTKANTISIIELTCRSHDLFHKSFECTKSGNYQRAQEYLNEGNKLLLQANQVHFLLLSENNELDLLLVHAEDMLISIQLYKSMMKEFVEFYKNKEFPTLKGN